MLIVFKMATARNFHKSGPVQHTKLATMIFDETVILQSAGQRNELDEHHAIFDAVMSRQLEQAQVLIADHYQRTASLFSAVR